MEESQKKGLIKILSGIVVSALGILTGIIGFRMKNHILKFLMLIVSLTCLGSGYYLIYSGISDYALGKMGEYVVGSGEVQPITFKSPEDFKNSLANTVKKLPEIRRLTFKCPDGSKSFKVYLNPIYPIGIPNDSVVCADGFKLLSYEEAH